MERQSLQRQPKGTGMAPDLPMLSEIGLEIGALGKPGCNPILIGGQQCGQRCHSAFCQPDAVWEAPPICLAAASALEEDLRLALRSLFIPGFGTHRFEPMWVLNLPLEGPQETCRRTRSAFWPSSVDRRSRDVQVRYRQRVWEWMLRVSRVSPNTLRQKDKQGWPWMSRWRRFPLAQQHPFFLPSSLMSPQPGWLHCLVQHATYQTTERFSARPSRQPAIGEDTKNPLT